MMAAPRDDLRRDLTYQGVTVTACSCRCHRDGDESEALRAMARVYGGANWVDVTDVAGAVLACDACSGLHAVALTVDHDALEAERQRIRDHRITHPQPDTDATADEGEE